jgi:hypothetical protein
MIRPTVMEQLRKHFSYLWDDHDFDVISETGSSTLNRGAGR